MCFIALIFFPAYHLPPRRLTVRYFKVKCNKENKKPSLLDGGLSHS